MILMLMVLLMMILICDDIDGIVDDVDNPTFERKDGEEQREQ